MQRKLRGYFENALFREVRRYLGRYPIMVAVLLLGFILTLLTDNFLSANNIINVLRQSSMVGIITVGAYFVVVSGGLDASLGALVGFTSVVFGTMMVKLNIPVSLSIIASLLIGLASGIITGSIVTRLSIPPLIATMGMKLVLVGFTYIICQGYTIANVPGSIVFLGRGYMFGFTWLPIPVVILALLVFAASFVSQKTKFGRFVYAVGGNSEAAHLSGIKYRNIQTATYAIAGILAAISGIVITGRLGAGTPTSGEGWEFDAIIACVIGGVSTTGGRGRILGALLGSIMLGMLDNGMTLLSINSYFQQVVSGIVLIIAVAFDIYNVKRARSAAHRKSGCNLSAPSQRQEAEI